MKEAIIILAIAIVCMAMLGVFLMIYAIKTAEELPEDIDIIDL